MTNLQAGNSGNFKIDGTLVPKSAFIFSIGGGETLSILFGLQTWTPYKKYSEYSIDGIPAASMTELLAWIEDNCFKKKVVDSNFQGVATTGTEPVMEGGATYRALTVGTYTNFKDSDGTAIEVTQDDLDAGFVYLIGTEGVYDKDIDVTKEYVDQKIAGVDLIKVAANSEVTLGNQGILCTDRDGNLTVIRYTTETTNGALVIREGAGQISTNPVPVSDRHVTAKVYVDNLTNKKAQITALTKISDPATATTEQVATLLNSLIDALKA